MRILIIEDNSANLFLLKRILRIINCEISHFSHAEQALNALSTINPDLILTDIQLAGKLTGLDFIREVRQSGNTLPIIAMTAYAMDGEREKCIDAGCDEYVAKPFNVVQLTELFNQYLSDDKSDATV